MLIFAIQNLSVFENPLQIPAGKCSLLVQKHIDETEKNRYAINGIGLESKTARKRVLLLCRFSFNFVYRSDVEMFSQEVQVTNQVGLYARPATFFIQCANGFKSTILVEKEERRVNAKSLLGILSLGITKGTTITLIADGVDEVEAVNALTDLIQSNFSDSNFSD